MGYKNILLFKETVTHFWSGYVNWKDTYAMFADHNTKSSWVVSNGMAMVVLLFWPHPRLYILVTTPRLYKMTLHSSAFQTLSNILVSILHMFLVCCVCSAATCDQCSTLWLLHIWGVDTHMTDSVTHNDKVKITKGGQQRGATRTINHVGGQLFFIISKWKCLSMSRKFSTILYLLN